MKLGVSIFATDKTIDPATLAGDAPLVLCGNIPYQLSAPLLGLALELADRVDTVMVTVDPERDNDILTGYVQSFVPDAEAAGTLDAGLLAAAAAACCCCPCVMPCCGYAP